MWNYNIYIKNAYKNSGEQLPLKVVVKWVIPVLVREKYNNDVKK